VVLTMGDRPEALDRALSSALAQSVPMDVLVLANGCGPVAVPAGVRLEILPDNLGIPGGRNEGVRRTSADLLLFLDDDGYYPSAETAAALVGLGSPLITLQISNALTSETGNGAPNLAKAEALIMVLIVAIVMAGYYWIQKRSSRWLG